MDRQTIIDTVKIILVGTLGHEDFILTDELQASQVAGWDSLTHMMIITGIEDQFDIKFKLREINKLQNFRSLIDLIQSKV